MILGYIYTVKIINFIIPWKLILKNIILWSVKVAASYSKQRASIEDFLLSMIKNDSWLISFFDYIGITATDIEKNLNDLNMWKKLQLIFLEDIYIFTLFSFTYINFKLNSLIITFGTNYYIFNNNNNNNNFLNWFSYLSSNPRSPCRVGNNVIK